MCLWTCGKILFVENNNNKNNKKFEEERKEIGNVLNYVDNKA